METEETRPSQGRSDASTEQQKMMRTSAERRSHERQKTCRLRHDVPGIDCNSCAKSFANGRSVRHWQGYQPTLGEGRSGRSRRVFADKFP